MTKTWARRSVQAGAIAAGFLLVTAGAAQADGTDATTTGNIGVGSGNQWISPVQAPIDVCGNATAVLGTASAGCHGGSDATIKESRHAESGDLTSTGNLGAASGNQVYAPVQAPVDVCGNATSVGGVSTAGCHGGSDATLKNGGMPDATTTGNIGLGNGNQLIAPIQAPVDVCGNATAVLGTAAAGCKGGSDATAGGRHHGESALAEALPGLPGGALSTGSVNNLPVNKVQKSLSANKVGKTLPVDGVQSVTDGLPTAGVTDDITGTAAAKGKAKDAVDIVKPAESGRVAESGEDLTTTGNTGVGNGNQVYAPIQIPVDISGNSISVGGVSTAGSHGGSMADLKG